MSKKATEENLMKAEKLYVQVQEIAPKLFNLHKADIDQAAKLKTTRKDKDALLFIFLKSTFEVALLVGTDKVQQQTFINHFKYTDENGKSVVLKIRSDTPFETALIIIALSKIEIEYGKPGKEMLRRYGSLIKLAVKQGVTLDKFADWSSGKHDYEGVSYGSGITAASKACEQVFMSSTDRKEKADADQTAFNVACDFVIAEEFWVDAAGIDKKRMPNVALIPAYIDHKTHQLYLDIEHADFDKDIFVKHMNARAG